MDGLAARFVVPATARDVRLVSATSVPAYVRPGSSDTRRLGVSLRELVIDDGLTGARAIGLDDPRLEAGFHPCDGAGAAPCWRWTGGEAVLPPTLWDGCQGVFFLRVSLSGSALPRWIGPDQTVEVVDPAAIRRQV